jgi:iron complex outermembrane receptor protein
MQAMKRNKLRNAISVAIALSATGLTGMAFAQNATNPTEGDEAETLDTVVITGTRIKSQTMTASAPVLEIGAEQFKVTGFTRVDDLVNQYPQMSGYFDSFDNNGATGYGTVDLRNLGTNRTLTLINGRRLQPGSSIATDLSIIPVAMIERVDLLTGGASAVYGADAVAGVVNFVLNEEFEGVSFTAGYSGYQHNNDNEYMQNLMDIRKAARPGSAAQYDYPDGSNGISGSSYNFDMVVGSAFADGRGHASAWLTYRQNDPLFQGERDYSSCALNDPGTACGGSSTAGNPNYIFNQSFFASINPTTGIWQRGTYEAYNFAPINYYQRPESRYNFGATAKFEINEHAIPYVELLYTNRDNEIQVAESGTFFGQYLVFECDDLAWNQPGAISPCESVANGGLGISGPFGVYVGKRNVEGGPRNFAINDDQFRIVAGFEGAINDNWSYDISFLSGNTNNSEIGIGDFLSSKIETNLLNCNDPALLNTPQCYNVYIPGGVTVEAAQALQGNRIALRETGITSITGYVTGAIGRVDLVAGFDWREETYESQFDSYSIEGDFAGAGGRAVPLSGSTVVSELFLEANVPLITEAHGFLKTFNLDLGYRYSDYYETFGGENTYKIGFVSEMGPAVVRAGYNKAIRAPNIAELYTNQSVQLFQGADPCAGVIDADPNTVSPTQTAAQCALSGVTAAQYGNILPSPAGQYNQFQGGNPDLTPEEADTWTLGVAFTPLENLNVALDWYDITIDNQIGAFGANTILNGCGQGVAIYCPLINRNPVNGNLWVGEDYFVTNVQLNAGSIETSGLDFSADYGFEWLAGNWNVGFVGSYVLSYDLSPVPGDSSANYECAGIVNTSCGTLPDWKSIMTVNYAQDIWSVNARWRMIGSVDYINTNGTAGTVDRLVAANGGIGSYNFFDLSGNLVINSYTNMTLGVNNVFDKEPPLVGATLALNANAPGGYDQAGRFIFASVNVTF